MQHVVGMRNFERMRDAREDVRHYIEREVAVVLAQEPLERRPFHVLHDEVRRGILDLEVVHRDDVRIAELGNRPSFRKTGDVGGKGIVERAEIFGAFTIFEVARDDGATVRPKARSKIPRQNRERGGRCRPHIFGNVFPGGNVLRANDLRRRRWRGLVFDTRMTGRLRLIGGRDLVRGVK